MEPFFTDFFFSGLVDKSAAPHDKLTHQLYTEFDDFGRELISAFRLLSLLNERMDKGFRFIIYSLFYDFIFFFLSFLFSYFIFAGKRG